jgi:manganese/zinc/iron transport system substrate-binding protein
LVNAPVIANGQEIRPETFGLRRPAAPHAGPSGLPDGPAASMFLVVQKMFFGTSKTFLCGSAAAFALLLSLEGRADQPAATVVATTTVVADLVRQVGGERVAVDCLMGPGIDPHSYRATPRDADRLAKAKLVIASGLHLEGKLSELLSRLGRRAPVTAVADTLPRDQLLPVADNLHDPHVWFDARLWSLCVPAVVEALAKLDPGGREHYETRGADYARRLESLDGRMRDRLATIPKQRRVLVTAHDAFRYFGRAYDVEVVGVQGTSTESEAGLADINRLVETIVSRGIPAVFVETSVSDRNVTALREGAQARGHAVTLGGRLYSDALGGPGSGCETLEAMLTANMETIHAGLSGGR